MDRFPAPGLLPGRSRHLTSLLLAVAVSLVGFWIGCGDFCLFCDDENGSQGGPCDGDPCADIDNAQAGTCTAEGEDDFTCACDADFFWDGNENACKDPCIGEPCDSKDNAVDGSCIGVDADDYTCECEDGFVWDAASESCADDPCDPDPCAGIANAIEDTCEAAGAEDYTCECESGFVWDGDSCEAGPCDPDPCQDILFAVPGSCTAVGQSDFTCSCNSGYSWNEADNECEKVSGDACEELKACLKACSDFEDFTCQNACYVSYPGCTCLGDLASLILVCGGECPGCLFAQNKACYDCIIECAFANFCE